MLLFFWVLACLLVLRYPPSIIDSPTLTLTRYFYLVRISTRFVGNSLFHYSSYSGTTAVIAYQQVRYYLVLGTFPVTVRPVFLTLFLMLFIFLPQQLLAGGVLLCDAPFSTVLYLPVINTDTTHVDSDRAPPVCSLLGESHSILLCYTPILPIWVCHPSLYVHIIMM